MTSYLMINIFRNIFNLISDYVKNPTECSVYNSNWKSLNSTLGCH